MKHFLHYAATIAAAVLLGAADAAAGLSYATADGVRYVIDDGKRAVVCTPESGTYSGELTIPAKISVNGNSYKVYIGNGAFSGSEVVTLTMPETAIWVDIPTENSSSGSGLAHNSFEMGGSSSTPTYPSAEEIGKTFATHRAKWVGEFDSCPKLKAIYTTDESGNTSKSGCLFYKVKASSYDHRTYFVYAPKAIEGSVDLSPENTDSRLLFDAKNISDRPLIEEIVFPSKMNFNNGFKGCPALAKFTVNTDNSSYFSIDGVLYYHYYNDEICEAVPPAHRESFTCEHSIGNTAFSGCSIDNLFISTSYTQSGGDNAFEGFKGNINFKFPLADGCPLIKALAGAESEGYTLKCNPKNREEAAQYWRGNIENNDIYIESIKTGYTSAKIVFGGKAELYGKIKAIWFIGYDKDYGSYKTSDGGKTWEITDIPGNSTYSGLRFLYEDKNDESGTSAYSYPMKLTMKHFEPSIEHDVAKQTAIEFEITGFEEDDELNDFKDIKISTVGKLSGEWPRYRVSGLIPDKEYRIGIGNFGYYNFKTSKATVSYSIETTQTTIRFKEFEFTDKDDSWPDGDKLTWSTNHSTRCEFSQSAVVKRTSDSDQLYVHIYSPYLTDSWLLTTVDMKPIIKSAEPTPTAIETGILDGDADIESVEWSLKRGYDNYADVEVVNGAITGLIPGTKYSVQCKVEINDPIRNYYYTKTFEVELPQLQLKTLAPKVTGTGTAIVCAETNMSDYETRGGFQWKKYDAPASLMPSEAFAPVFGGRMEGAIKNLSMTNYYNVRAFYRNANGNDTYGEWVTFDPSDISFFEPTVHTYRAESVSHNAALARGCVIQGSEEIVEQGFEYAPSGSGTEAARKRMTAPLAADGVMTIEGNGQVMECSIEGLLPETSYVYRTYVRTADKVYYGETNEFTTAADPASGVSAVAAKAEVTLVGRYNLNGVPVPDDYRGFVIEIYSDGTTRKLIAR